MVQRSKSARSEPSQRQLRVGEDLRHHLAAILMRQETHIPELDKALSPYQKYLSVLILARHGSIL